MEQLSLRSPKVIRDASIEVQSDQACPIHWESEKAVGVKKQTLHIVQFQPSYRAQMEGWRTVKLDSFMKKLVFKLFFESDY